MTKHKKKRRVYPYVILFLLGFAITIYPIISNLYYRSEFNNEIAGFTQEAKDLSDIELVRRIELAKAYNDTLDPSKLADPYTDREKEGIAEYARMLEVHEQIGHIEVPKIGEDIPVYAGTSDSVLERGAGHLEGTSLPIGGQSTHAVITAHRGLPRAKLFRNLNKLEKGDIFYLHNIQTVLAYRVIDIYTVEPHEFEKALVVEGEDLLTLLTCTPYMINSHRLLVRGERIDYVPPVYEDKLAIKISEETFKVYLPLLGLTTLVALGLVIVIRKEYKKSLERYRNYERKEKDK